MKIMLTNARSLAPKIRSLQTFFEEHELDFAMITESWLKDGELLDRDVIDLEFGTNLKILYKNRPVRTASNRRVGGGVSIVYNKTSCNFRERRLGGRSFEIVAATGKTSKSDRLVAIFCIYIRPKMLVEELEALRQMLSDQVLQLKSKSSPMFFLGGDLNKRDLGPAFDDFNDIRQCNFEPTRGVNCLDIMFSNATVDKVSTWPPLETDGGVGSDHQCVVFDIKEERVRNFTWIRRTTRKHTEQACIQYGAELDKVDWHAELPPSMPVELMLDRFNEINGEITDRLFPLRSVRIRSNEDEWITEGIRRLSRSKRRVYKREGKSLLWHRLDAEMDAKMEQSKADFVARAKASGGNSRQYLAAIKSLASKEKPKEWSVCDMFPGKSEEEVGNEVTEYFTAITDQFRPILPSIAEAPKRRPLTVGEVEKKLKDAKKPNSAVPGDLLPRIVKRHYSKLALPVSKIFNAVFDQGEWPTRWKEETAVVIPKVPNPSSLAECRNISCTAFLSKVLESVVLEDLRSEIEQDPDQYGGVKKCSVDHLLIDLYDKLLSPLEEGNVSVLLGIDFEKAFNRLDHGECLKQLRDLGASPTSIALVRTFLTGRVMCARVGTSRSQPRRLLGGSPQGSILGCYLYCAATQQLGRTLVDQRNLLSNNQHPSTPELSPAASSSSSFPASPVSSPARTSPGFDLLGSELWPHSRASGSPARRGNHEDVRTDGSPTG